MIAVTEKIYYEFNFNNDFSIEGDKILIKQGEVISITTKDDYITGAVEYVDNEEFGNESIMLDTSEKFKRSTRRVYFSEIRKIEKCEG